MSDIKVPFLISGEKLQKSKYTDVNILKYTPAEKHPENKYVAIVDFSVRKYICVDTKEEIVKLIEEHLEESKED